MREAGGKSGPAPLRVRGTVRDAGPEPADEAGRAAHPRCCQPGMIGRVRVVLKWRRAALKGCAPSTAPPTATQSATAARDRETPSASARRSCALSPNVSPVFGLRSKRGKLLLETSSADAVTRCEHVARRADVDRDLGRLARRQQRRRRPAVAVARAQDAVGQRPRRAVGEDVDQLRGEVGVGRASTTPTASPRSGRSPRRPRSSGAVV